MTFVLGAGVTVDASVFVSAVREKEEHYEISRKFLGQVQLQNLQVFCPTLIIPECVAAIVRRTKDQALCKTIKTLVNDIVGDDLVPIDEPLAQKASDIAKILRLRGQDVAYINVDRFSSTRSENYISLKGSDSVYVAAAQITGSALITWDTNLLECGAAVVPTLTPKGWLEQFAI